MHCRNEKETPLQKISSNTDAVLLNRKIRNPLCNTGVDEISVSIDRRSREENNFVRRRSTCAQFHSDLLMAQKWHRQSG
jgi:hypothetical protein